MTSPDLQRKKRVEAAFVVAVALLLATPATVQVVSELRAHAPLHEVDVFRQEPTPESLRAYEKDLAARLVVAAPIRSAYTELGDRLFLRGNAKVVERPGGWFYYAQGLRYVAGPGLGEVHATDAYHVETRANDAAGAIRDFAAQLRARGIALALVLVPDKATVVPEHLDPALAPDAAPNNVDLVPLVRSLEADGITVIELTASLLAARARGVDVFLPRDTHWSPDGAVVAAASVAARLRTLPAVRAATATPVTFDHREVAFEARGDLYELLAYAAERPAPSPMRYVVEQVLAEPGGPAPTDARRAPILLLGDSFTVIYGDAALGMGQRGGFGEHLADELGAPLDVIAMPGGGADRARKALALRPEGTAGKTLVVWEIAERNFADPDVVWTRIALRPATAEMAQIAAPPPKTEVHLRARLTGASPLPKHLGYPDCLTILRYERLAGAADPAVAPGPIFVAAWGTHDWKEGAALAYPVGAVHDLVLVPIGERHDLERTCFSDAVGMDRQPWWGEAIDAVR